MNDIVVKNIEKDICMPKGMRGRPPKYPFRDMEVGDSFVVLNKGSSIHSVCKEASDSLSPKVFKARKEIDFKYRVWRIA